MPRKLDRIEWTRSRLLWLMFRYARDNTEQIAADLGISAFPCYSKARRLGLRKADPHQEVRRHGRRPEYRRWAPHEDVLLRQMYQTTTLTTIGGYLGRSMDSVRQRAKTLGLQEQRRLPVGTTKDKSNGYLITKVADPDQWELTHHLVWKQAGRQIPPGSVLGFKDFNRLNFALDNLVLMTTSEMAKRNGERYPYEIRECMRLLGLINRKIERRENGK